MYEATCCMHVLLMVGTLLKGLHSNWHHADEMISQKSFFSRRTRQCKVTPWHPRQVCTRLLDQIFNWDTLNKHPTGLCYTKLGRIVYWHTSWPWTLDSGFWTLDLLPYCLLLPFPSRWHLDLWCDCQWLGSCNIRRGNGFSQKMI